MKVKTWIVTAESDGSIRKFLVMAPTRYLAKLNFRFGEEYVGYNYCTILKIGLKRA